MQQYPDSDAFHLLNAHDIQKLRKGSEDLKRIEAANLAPDQKRLEIGRACWSFVIVSWNNEKGKDGYIVDLKKSPIQAKIKKYMQDFFVKNPIIKKEE